MLQVSIIVGLVSAALLGSATGMAQRSRPPPEPGVQHLGTWKCVLYGHPGLGDERLLIRFHADGRAEFARPSSDARRPWSPLSGWQVDSEQVLSFSDLRSGREFQADLTRSTLGGTWRTVTLLGGWWCAAVESVVADVEVIELGASEDNALMPPLIPEVMATPSYPVAAIRRGLQGRTVGCFFVSADGRVVQPDIVEISDEVFRAPTLEALVDSRYRRWSAADEGQRPGCRSYVFRLDAVDPVQ
jgi:hypothetical protein